MSGGNVVDMSLDDIIKMGGRGRGGRGRGASRGRGGRGRGRGGGVGRSANIQQQPRQQGPGTRRRQQQQQQQQVGRGMGRSQRRGLRRGGNLSGRGRGITARVGFNNNRQQLSTRGGGVVKRRIGNLRGQGRGRGGMAKLKTAIQTQLQQQGQGNRGRGRGRGAVRANTTTTTTTSTEQFKNFQVSISGPASTQGSGNIPEGVSMDISFSVKHTTGITLNSRFTPQSEANMSSNSRLITANGRAVKRF